MVVAIIAFASRRMKGNVGHHATGHELALAELAHQLDALPVVSSAGRATRISRATCEFFRVSAASTAFHSAARSCTHAGALAGARVST